MNTDIDRVLVTGAGCYLGSVLVGRLLTLGHAVIDPRTFETTPAASGAPWSIAGRCWRS